MNTTFKLFTILVLSLMITKNSTAQNVYIPDANFRAYLQTTYPSCMSGNDLITNCSEVTSVATLDISDKNISDLTGVEYFTGLTFLNCSFNQLTSLPTLPSSLQILNCVSNQLTFLPTVLPSSLIRLFCNRNQLTSLPVLPSTLEELGCNNNQLTFFPTLPNTLCFIDAGGSNTISCLPNIPTCSTFAIEGMIPVECTATAATNSIEVSMISAYPNPFNNSFFLQLPESLTEGSSLLIYDLKGKLCETQQDLKVGETIEMGRLLQPGLYVVQLETAQGKNRMRLIKQ